MISCNICGATATSGGIVHRAYCLYGSPLPQPLPPSQPIPPDPQIPTPFPISPPSHPVTDKGWECPKCGRVYAPWKSRCPHCGPSFKDRIHVG